MAAANDSLVGDEKNEFTPFVKGGRRAKQVGGI
jgi:hypothetical protein